MKLNQPNLEDDIVYRLRKHAEICRQIPARKSVQQSEPDRIADLLEEAAKEIEDLRRVVGEMDDIIDRLEQRLYAADD